MWCWELNTGLLQEDKKKEKEGGRVRLLFASTLRTTLRHTRAKQVWAKALTFPNRFFPFVLFGFVCFTVWEIKPRASWLLGKHYHWTTSPAPTQWLASLFQPIYLASCTSILVNLTSTCIFPVMWFLFLIVSFPTGCLCVRGKGGMRGEPSTVLRRAFYWITIQWINPQLIYTQHSTSVCSLFCAFLLPYVWEMQHKNKARSGITYWESTQRHFCKWKRPPCQGATTAPQESVLGLLQGCFLHLCSSGHRSSRVHLLCLPRAWSSSSHPMSSSVKASLAKIVSTGTNLCLSVFAKGKKKSLQWKENTKYNALYQQVLNLFETSF